MNSTKFGGLENYLLSTIEACKALGFNSIIQYESKPQSAEYLKLLANLDAEIAVHPTLGQPLKGLQAVSSLMIRHKPTIVQTHFVDKYVLSLVPIFAKVIGTKKCLSMVHNKFDFKGKSSRRFAYNLYDHILAVSNAVAADLVTAGVRERILDVLYLGLSSPPLNDEGKRLRYRKEFGISPSDTLLATIAFEAPFKGNDVLVDAMEIVVKERTDIHWLSIGIDPKQSKLATSVAERSLEGNVHWGGIRDRGSDLLNAADVYIQPSRFGEGLPLALMEAMALSLPVISTSVSGNSEAVEDSLTGILVEPGNPEDLAKAILMLSDDKERWSTLGQSGYQRYNDLFLGSASVKRLVDEYYDLRNI
jgi:glycosyltransferase involved in cell wall biosynthesis